MGQRAGTNKDLEQFPLSFHELFKGENAASKYSSLTSNHSAIAYINKKGILFHADCLDLMSGIKNESIDLVFTDPPFNLGKNYDTTSYSDNMKLKHTKTGAAYG